MVTVKAASAIVSSAVTTSVVRLGEIHGTGSGSRGSGKGLRL
ncbi:hypothetical protein EVA_07905 [gut metagenome]|uniref:Uncharacterized protein n=1 Tax=gut metagenome TaxID=749906 RepID=J9GU94_9ZZZZ